MADESQSTTGQIIDGLQSAASIVTTGGSAFVVSTDASLSQSQYDFSYRMFPLDLGDNSQNINYLIFNISVSNFSQLGSVTGPNGAIQPWHTLAGEMSKTDALRFTIDKQFSTSLGSLNQSSLIATPRLTTRIAESIALFMPDTSVYTTQNEYTEISLMDIFQSAIGDMSRGLTAGARLVSAGTDYALRQLGLPINPRVEVMYKTTPQRRFQFEFLFGPTNEAESLAVDQIIRTFRLHSVPEVNPITSGIGVFFVKPSEFDITFYHKGKENKFIPRINTCVLEQIDVDYAPTGRYSTFRNGCPVSAKLMLQFRETEILHKLRVLQGF
jgi:hypothetical protein